MAVGVELVDQHAVIAGQVAQHFHHRIGQHTHRRRGAEALQRRGERRGHHLRRQVLQLDAVRRRRGRFQLQHQAAVGEAVQCTVEAALGRPEAALQRDGLAQVGALLQLSHTLGDVAAQHGQRPLQQRVGLHPEQPRHVAAELAHAQLGASQHQQRAMRLHRSREMDQFALAVGKVGLAEGGCRVHRCPVSVFFYRSFN